jgi:flagellar motor protein MotB
VATIQFDNASSDLDSRDRTILRNVVALQRERGGIIRVVGHASHRTANMDPVSHKLVNYDISSERAEMVAKTLAELGARTQDIVVVAKADVEPLYYEVMPAGEAGNRRTEVYLDF